MRHGWKLFFDNYMLISNNSSIILNNDLIHLFLSFCMCVCMSWNLHVWMHIHMGCTCTGVQVCRGQRLTSGLFLYCSLPWVLRQDLLLPIKLAQGIPCLSLGDRITEKVTHLVFMLVLGSELCFSRLHGKCFMHWTLSLLHWTLSAVLLRINWQCVCTVLFLASVAQNFQKSC